jgi:hypothetical protein
MWFCLEVINSLIYVIRSFIYTVSFLQNTIYHLPGLGANAPGFTHPDQEK